MYFPLKIIFCLKSMSLLCNAYFTPVVHFLHQGLKQFPILAVELVPYIQWTNLQGYFHMHIVQDMACVANWWCVLSVILVSAWTLFVTLHSSSIVIGPTDA